MYLSSVFAIGLAFAGQTPRAESADAILASAKHHYNWCRTFQGELEIKSRKDGHDYEQLLELKAQNDGKGSIARSVISIKADTTPAGAGPMDETLIDDGQAVTILDHAWKSYSTVPHTPDSVFGMFDAALKGIRARGSFAVTTAAGATEPVWVLSFHDKQRSAVLRIGKHSGSFLSFHAEPPKGVSGESVDIVLRRQLFDSPIPASTFHASPPTDYEKVKGSL